MGARRKVRVVKPALPKAAYGMSHNYGYSMPVGSHPSYAGSQFAPGVFFPSDNGSKDDLTLNTTLKPTNIENATLEAEKGEVVVTNLNQGGIPEVYKVGGKRHSDGGTPLNLPNDSFVFSRDKKLKIKDPDILDVFGKKPKKGKRSYLPSELAWQYQNNKEQQVLLDPDSDKLQKDTAELMIQNNNLKLGGLAMVQESMKGFPSGIPGIAMPYLESTGINPEEIPQLPGENAAPEQPVAKYGGSSKSGLRRVKVTMPSYQGGGQPTVGMTFDDWLVSQGHNVGFYPDNRVWDGSQWVNPDGSPVATRTAPDVSPWLNYDPSGTFIGGRSVTGGAPVMSSKTTKYQNIPDDAVKWDQNAEGYDESQIQEGDYVKQADGTWIKVTGFSTKETPYEGDYQNEMLGSQLSEAYGRLQQTIMENPDLQTAIVNKYRENMDKAQPGKNLTQEDLDRARAMNDEEIINNFLAMQEQVMAVNAQGITGDPQWDESDSWDKSRDNYVRTITDLGFTPLEPWQAAAFQGAYIGIQELKDDPNYSEILKDYVIAKEGREDEPLGRISNIDGWVGNTTIGQAVLWAPTAKALETEEVEWTEDQEIKHLEPQVAAEWAPYWKQDKIRTGAALLNRMRIQDHRPWQATPETYLPSPVFEDPTRAYAASAELANIGTQAAAAFAGPQALGARFAQIQGQGAQNIANIQADVHNRNVGIANQFELAKTNILNTAADRRAQLATQLWDKNVIANQQFDNARAQAFEQMTNAYVDAVTNRAQAQAMNTMFDDYRVDPRTGGFVQFDPSYSPITPTQGTTTSVSDRAFEIQRQNPGMTHAEALSYAKADAGIPDTYGGFGVDPAQFAYPGGYQPT